MSCGWPSDARSSPHLDKVSRPLCPNCSHNCISITDLVSPNVLEDNRGNATGKHGESVLSLVLVNLGHVGNKCYTG